MPNSRKQNGQAGQGGKGRGQSAAAGAIRESVKIEVEAALERFAKSLTETEFDFPPGFTSAERAHIHKLSKSLGLESKSYGKGSDRHLRVSRRGAAVTEAPDVVRIAPAVVEVLSKVRGDAPTSKDGGHCPPAATTDGRTKQLFATAIGKLTPLVPPPPTRPAHLAAFRAKLPVWEKQSELLELISAHQTVLVCGGTGCGKTTQVPQFILDEATQRGEAVQVICTQPRRISATGVGNRVATERGEAIGGTVGYCIKLDSRMCKRTVLTFCTSGVLLRAQMADESLGSLTHIIVDEIHERDRFCDFLLISLRNLLRRRPRLRLILMSATMNTDLFVRYFDDCPVVHVEGRAFPVTPIFLGDVLFHTGHRTRRMRAILTSSGQGQDMKDNDARLSRAVTQLAASAAELGSSGAQPPQLKGEDSSSAADGSAADGEPDDDDDDDDDDDVIIVDYDAEPDDDDDDGDGDDIICEPAGGAGGESGGRSVQHDHWREETSSSTTAAGANASGTAQQSGLSSSELSERDRLLMAYQESFNDDLVDTELIITLIQKLVAEGEEGAILVFLPGYDEIASISEQLRRCPQAARMDIIMLHSMLQQSDQNRVFQRSPHGKRKVVLSTNLAETSITIDDVVFVIDSCKVKEKSYDSAAGVSTLQTIWVSQASALQRRGRAGRCQAGICYHLMSGGRFERLAPHQTPEIMRIHLQELCLHTKILTPPSVTIVDFLSGAPDPPPVIVLQRAVRSLRDIGALDDGETLTALGHHLSRLTLEPRLGKMVLYSVLFQCVDPIVVIACCLSYREPFVLPRKSDMERAAASRLRLAANGASDHLVMYTAFQEWRRLGGLRSSAATRFCNQNFISPPIFETVLGMRNQLMGQLRAAGFINNHNETKLNLNADKMAVIKGVLCAGLYPSLARKNPLNGKLMTPLESKVRIHASSILASLEPPSQDWGRNAAPAAEADDASVDEWVVYEELVRTRRYVSVKCCSTVSPLTVMLMAGNCSAAAGQPIAAAGSRATSSGSGGVAGGSATASSASPLPRHAAAAGVVAPTTSGCTGTSADPATPCPSGGTGPSQQQQQAPQASADTAARHGGERPPSEDDGPAVPATLSATLDIDDWISFRLEPELLTCLTILRQRLSQAFLRFLTSPNSRRPQHDQVLVSTMVTALCVDDASKARDGTARAPSDRPGLNRPQWGQQHGGGLDRNSDRCGAPQRQQGHGGSAQRPAPGGSSPGPKSCRDQSTRGRGQAQRQGARPEKPAAAAVSGRPGPNRPQGGRQHGDHDRNPDQRGAPQRQQSHDGSAQRPAPGGSSPGPKSGRDQSARGRGRGLGQGAHPEQSAVAGTQGRPERGRGGRGSRRGIRSASSGGSGHSDHGVQQAANAGQSTEHSSAHAAAPHPGQGGSVRLTSTGPQQAPPGSEVSGVAEQSGSPSSSSQQRAASRRPPRSGVRLAANFGQNAAPR